MTSSRTPGGSSLPTDRAVLVEQLLATVAAQARRDSDANAPASAQARQRQGHYLRAQQRRRTRRRAVGGSMAGVAAAAAIITTATYDWPGAPGQHVQVVPAAPSSVDPLDEQAQVYPDDPASLPADLATMAEGCAYDADAGRDADPTQRAGALASGTGAQAMQHYRVVYAAHGELSQAVGVQRDDTGAQWLCSAAPTLGMDGSLTSIDQFEDEDLNRTPFSLPINAGSDGSYLVDIKGWTGGRIAAVTLTTPDRTAFEAVVQGDIWWATPRVTSLEQTTAITWTAYDANGDKVASGSTQ